MSPTTRPQAPSPRPAHPSRMDVTRHVTRRDGRKEGEPDVEPGAGTGPEQAMKDAQRDLTSLSGPPPRAKGRREG